ncbi:MAG: cell division protein FtsQ/DivIB [Lachnospiraceae bacterium]|nr:cell division protein FtsQ/DivIB [Lachnospiraceae bacterium]
MKDIKKSSKKKKRPVKQKKIPKVRERKPFEGFEFHIDKHTVKILIIVTAIVMVLGCAFGYFVKKYTVDTIIVEGSTHYTTEEISRMVIGDGFLSKNSVLLSLKYRNKEIKDVPFIETMSVRIMSPTSIKITIYEKAIAGYVEYLGQYIYFDKDGTVVESSDIRTEGIPQVMGMKFDHVVLWEKLPVSDEEIFKNILDVSQLLGKYEIKVDKIYFDDNYNVTLYFDDARVKLGSFDNIDEKIIKLKAILPELKGRKGVLRLENYTVDSGYASFEEDE